MMNQIVLVGHLVETPILEEIEDIKCTTITLAVKRCFKNEKGEYEVDMIPITLFDEIASNVAKYCNVQDTIGVRGRIEMQDSKIVIRAEKITFLSCKSEEGE